MIPCDRRIQMYRQLPRLELPSTTTHVEAGPAAWRKDCPVALVRGPGKAADASQLEVTVLHKSRETDYQVPLELRWTH